MENKKGLSFVFTIIAIIISVTLFKQFDFRNYTFEKPALAVVYTVVFVFSIYLIKKKQG